jgi:hypothetical protein
MIRVLHLFDASVRWEHRVLLRQLADGLPAAEFDHHVAAVDSHARRGLGPNDPLLFPRRFNLNILDAPRSMRRYLRTCQVDVIHAWGAQAAAVAEHGSHAGGQPVAVTIWDAGLDARQTRLLRTDGHPDQRPVVCGGAAVRRHLAAHGVDAARCRVIPPAVDVAQIDAARGSGLRLRLGLGPEHTLLTTPAPAASGGGHFAAFWLTAVRSFLDPNIRLVLPGISREQRRLARLAAQLDMNHLLICTGRQVPCEQVIAIADATVVAPSRDVSPAGLAWALAAGVPVIATAVDSVTEWIEHGVNGWLLAPGPAKRLATRLAAAVSHLDQLREMADAAIEPARRQFAPEIAGRAYQQLYRNLADGRAAWSGGTENGNGHDDP